jgi:hypothetical protein
MALVQNVPRNLEAPARILGLTPIELAACALLYAAMSSIFRGIPFSAFLSLGVSVGAAITLFSLNRLKPPQHGLFFILACLRPAVTWVSEEKEY